MDRSGQEKVKKKLMSLFVLSLLLTSPMPIMKAEENNSEPESEEIQVVEEIEEVQEVQEIEEVMPQAFSIRASDTTTNYLAIITKPWTINTQPHGSEGAVLVPRYRDYLGQEVRVINERTTDQGTFALLSQQGVEIGWINVTGIETVSEITSTRAVDYYADIVKPWSINTEPYGTGGFAPVPNYTRYLGSEVRVIEEKTTATDTYALFSIEDTVIGWINITGLAKKEIISYQSTPVQYEAIVRQGWSINTQPYGTTGYEFVQYARSLVGKTVTVVGESTTERSTYVLIASNGETLGWLDKDAIEPHAMTTIKNVNYQMTIKQPWSINTQPWGVPGYQAISGYDAYHGSYVTVIREATTQRGKFGLIAIGNQQIGWIDLGALSSEIPVEKSYEITYEAEVTEGWSINTEPWGTAGYKYVQSAKSLIGKAVSITAEKVTPRSTYALVTYQNKVLGWIDKDALNPLVVQSESNVSYSATVVKPWSINTKPWGTSGYQAIANQASYRGKDFVVTREAVTRRGTYSLLTQDGVAIGWIDKTGLDTFHTVLSTKDVNYRTLVVKPWSINSGPWGTKNAKSVANPQNYLWKQVIVTQEKTTERGTFALITVNNKQVGWIDKTGLGFASVNKTVNTNYKAKIVKPWAITNVPWGTEGFKTTVDSNKYLNTEVVVTQEKTTAKGTYALLTQGGKSLGWMDKTGLSLTRIISTKDVHYRGKISKPWTINTRPYGTEGYATIANYHSHLGKDVVITKEAKTSDGETYLYLVLNGTALGWINKTGISEPSQKIVYLDPGHGGNDPGATYYGVMEKTINLQVSKKIQALLEQRGYKVIMSRTTDVSIDYKTERSRRVNATDADIFISVHHNAMPGNSYVNGIETFYYEYEPDYPSKINKDMHNDMNRVAESGKLAYAIHNSLIKNSGAYDRKVRRSSFAVLRETAIPAVLLELGFMSNRTELNRLLTNSYQDTLAKAVVDGVANYYK